MGENAKDEVPREEIQRFITDVSIFLSHFNGTNVQATRTSTVLCVRDDLKLSVWKTYLVFSTAKPKQAVTGGQMMMGAEEEDVPVVDID